ncbi:MAG TPA: hypothetical protein VFR93_03545 [Candidatus Limnocylindrales bacterium]|nr:hypothetical protein [Candidatus Limnocylindrales bacterium]
MADVEDARTRRVHPGAEDQDQVDFTERALLVRDVLDGQLLSTDTVRLARVADVDLELDRDGTLRVTHLVVGPHALARRIARPIGRMAGRLLGDRHDHRIGVGELLEVGPWLRLLGRASDYDLGAGDRWLVDHLLRFIPGSGADLAGTQRKRWKVR